MRLFQTRTLVLITLMAACTYLSSCSLVRRGLTGELQASAERDTLTIAYDIHIPDGDIDSVAIQFLPKFDSRLIKYDSETRVKDSLYRSLGDSLDCCYKPFWVWLFSQPGDSLSDTSETAQASVVPCWWMPLVDTTHPMTEAFYGPYEPPWERHGRVDSVLATASLDSLRRRSIPCTWRASSDDYGRGPQMDFVLYRRNDNNRRNGGSVSGTLKFASFNSAPPPVYCLKVYGTSEEQPERWSDPLDRLWEGIIPKKPEVRLYRFEEQGGFLGMAMGIGASAFSRGGLPDANTGTNHMPALTIAFSYYSPKTIYQFSGELFGLDSSGNDPSLNTCSLLGIRHYPFTRNSAGWSWYGSAEFTNFRATAGTVEINDDEFGIEAGVGYDTDFDRLTYSYHTAQGGYHEVELLVGLIAVQQGKAGLKATILRGDLVRSATIQVYQENRVGFQTMELHRRRSLPVQALIYAGMIAAWAVVH